MAPRWAAPHRPPVYDLPELPGPTPEDRLLFILGYLKMYPLQVVQWQLFGVGQRKADQWIHVLQVVLQATLRTLGDAPSRSVAELPHALEPPKLRRLRSSCQPGAAGPSRSVWGGTHTGNRLPPFGHDGTERRIARRRTRLEHVNSSVKRCRIVHDTSRLRKAGVRDLVMEIYCALRKVRVRLTPWQPMV